MKLIEKISPDVLLEKFYNAGKRFPLTLFFLLVLSVFLVANNHDGSMFSDQFWFFIIYYSATMAVLSLSLKLWSEEVANKRLTHITQLIVYAIWLMKSVYLAEQVPFHDIILVNTVFSVNVLLVLSVWLLSFFKSNTDVPLWNFIWRTVQATIICVLIGVALSLSLCLLFFSFKMLFDIDFQDVYVDIWIIVMCFIVPILFVQMIPSGELKHDHNNHLNKFARAVTKFLVLPVAIAYLATLYAYAFKILLQWELPNGWVGYLVAALMAVMLLLIFLVYPTRNDQGQRLNKWLMRWLPVLVLPLLMLMTIGVVRRLNDYGITVARLYLVLFNIWCYAVCLMLFLSRSKRFYWVMASFGIVLFLASVGPWSFGNITRRVMCNSVKTSMKNAGFTQLPLDSLQFSRFLEKIDAQNVNSVVSKMQYLERNFNKENIEELVDSTVYIWQYYLDVETMAVESEYYSFYNPVETLPVPPGYGKFGVIECSDENFVHTITDEKVLFQIGFNGKFYHFAMSVEQLKKLSKLSDNKVQATHLTVNSNDGAMLVITFFALDLDRMYFSINGIIFIK